MIRLFVHAHETGDVSALGLAYTDALVAAKLPLRVIAIEPLELWDEVPPRAGRPGKPAHPWSRHRQLFAVPITGGYINVVCSMPHHWSRLYTVGVRNVLLTDQPPTAHGKLFAQVIVPTPEIAQRWTNVVPADQIAVVPVALGPQLAILTNALFGPDQQETSG